MTKTLGVFGDSYADTRNNNSYNLGWPDLTAQKLGMELINTGEQGTALFNAFENFKKYQEKCDSIIFVVTEPGRYTKPVILNNGKFSINSIVTLENIVKDKNSEFTSTDRKILNDLRGYYNTVDKDWEECAHYLLLDKISNMRPDAILVPCFGPSITSNKLRDYNILSEITLFDISNVQTSSLGTNPSIMTYNWWRKYRELKTLVCHLTKETNEYVSTTMVQSINTGSWNCVLPSKINHEKPLDFYVSLR